MRFDGGHVLPRERIGDGAADRPRRSRSPSCIELTVVSEPLDSVGVGVGGRGHLFPPDGDR
jgi:hypothetical protein